MTRAFSLARLRRDAIVPGEGPGRAIYLVGGIVRDGFRGRTKGRDIDLAVPDGEEALARRLSRLGWGKAFRIAGARHGISVWRVAGPAGVVDVARFGGSGGLAGDLGRRDFTVNAMARDLATGLLFDPFGGRRDLVRGVIRAIRAENFDDDPLRLLRAYRLAAQLSATVEPATRALIRPRAASLAGVAAERVRDELEKLLSASAPGAARAIDAAVRDGVLAAAIGSPAGKSPGLRALGAAGGPDALLSRLALVLRRSGVRSLEAARLLSERRFGAPLCRNVGARLLFLEAALDRRFDGRALHKLIAALAGSASALVSAAAATPAERRRARRVRRWLEAASFTPLPASGTEISAWLAVPPGPVLGRAIAEARYRHFVGEWTGRRALRQGLRAWLESMRRIDRPQGLG